MKNETVLYERVGTTAIITLNRPARLNAINADLLKGLIDALIVAGGDDAAVTVILTGAGRAFCAGEDLKETSDGKTPEEFIREAAMLQEVQRAILRLGKPLIAAVEGYAVGGGCEFAMSCDIRIASTTAMFGFPETEVGLTVTTAGTKILAQLVGLGKAKEMIFTGEFVDAEAALGFGLVNRVVPAEKLHEETMAIATKIGKKSPLSLRLSRTAIDQGLHSSFDQILDLEESHLMTCFASGNYKKFMAQKMDKMGRKIKADR